MPRPVASRRRFLKLAGIAGAGLALLPASHARGASLLVENDPGLPSRLPSRSRSLLKFAQVTDVHITDTTNPLRADAIDFAVSAALRPQEHLSSRTFDAILRDINREGEMAFLISTGDQIDNAMAHEGRWFVAVADGENGMPESYQKQAGTRPNRQSPLEVPDFTPAGVNVPYYVAVGNHDVMVVGNFNAKFVETVFADLLAELARIKPEKWGFNITDLGEFMETFTDSGTPSGGHGFGLLPPENPDGFYAFSPADGIRCLVLNTTNDNWLEGIGREYRESRGKRLARSAASRISGLSDTDAMERAIRAHIKEQIRDFNTYADARAKALGIDFEWNDGMIGGLPQGTLDTAQADWLEQELTAHPDAICLIFSHHGPDSFMSPPGNLTGETFVQLLERHANVVAHIHGHTHENRIVKRHTLPSEGDVPGYWDITTASLAEYPMEWREITILAHEDGTGTLSCRMKRPRWSAYLFGPKADWRAYKDYRNARYTAALDYQSVFSLEKMKGEKKDRDVDLPFRLPGGVLAQPSS